MTLDISFDKASDCAGDERQEEHNYVARLQTGDVRAFEQLFEVYVPRLYRFVSRTMGVSDILDVEDVLQETMLAALRTLDRFRGDCSLFTWLCAIARHKVQDHIRRQQRLRNRISSEPLDDLRETTGCVSDVGGRVAQQQALEQALGTLPEDYRAVLVGKYIEGFTVSELARVMARSEKSVESLLTRARSALRERLVDARTD
jgi:RNA polymerase sigma-70 factor (ECF subfamily)